MNKKSSDNNDNVFPEFSTELNFPENIDRRTFLIRNAVIGAAAVMTGTTWTPEARAEQALGVGRSRQDEPAVCRPREGAADIG